MLEFLEVRVEAAHDLAGFNLHRVVIDKARRGRQSSSQKEARSGVEIGRQRQRLIDRLNIQRAGIAGAVDLSRRY